jgi:peptidyl-prolyl cis-trans isomerase C
MFKIRTGAAAVAIAFAMLSAGVADAAPAKKKAKEAAEAPAVATYATVNGVRIPQSLADAFLKEQLAQGIPNSPELQKMVREELVRREVVAQAARAKGLDKSPDIAAQIELSKQALLIRAYVKNFIDSNPTSDEAIRAEYDRARPLMSEKEFKSRHVLVETEDEAKAIIAKLDAGEKIEKLAAQSKDPGSKDNGGDLGWSAATSYVKPFADALNSLEKGQYTKKPVKTEFGFHVIMLEDTRAAEPPPFEHVKGQIAQHMQQQKVEKLIADLQAKAKIE